MAIHLLYGASQRRAGPEHPAGCGEYSANTQSRVLIAKNTSTIIRPVTIESITGLSRTPRSSDARIQIPGLAHNLLRWIAAIGLGARSELVVAKTLRRTLLSLPGRLTRSARRSRLHLPVGWPWAPWFELALARLRCVAYATLTIVPAGTFHSRPMGSAGACLECGQRADHARTITPDQPTQPPSWAISVQTRLLRPAQPHPARQEFGAVDSGLAGPLRWAPRR
jgi:hypothetical protein